MIWLKVEGIGNYIVRRFQYEWQLKEHDKFECLKTSIYSCL